MLKIRKFGDILCWKGIGKQSYRLLEGWYGFQGAYRHLYEKSQMSIAFDPVILLLGIYTTETLRRMQDDVYIDLLIIISFIRTK